MKMPALLLSVAVLTVSLTAGCTSDSSASSVSSQPSVASTAVDAAAPTAPLPKGKKKASATTLLNALPVAPEVTNGYDREKFNHWTTTDGCDTRELVLIRQASGGTVKDCKVTGGKWFSEYDGVTTTDPSEFDIDHRVALGQAWASGANKWTDDEREQFANDMTYRPSLIAVSASSNRSKSDRDPAEWMPPSKDNWCPYLKNWVAVKYRWGLAVDPAEKSFIATNLKPCEQKMKVPPLARSWK